MKRYRIYLSIPGVEGKHLIDAIRYLENAIDNDHFVEFPYYIERAEEEEE